MSIFFQTDFLSLKNIFKPLKHNFKYTLCKSIYHDDHNF